MVRTRGRVFQGAQSPRLGPGSAGQCSADSGARVARGRVNRARKGPEARKGPHLRSWLSREAGRRQFGGAEAVQVKDPMGVGTASGLTQEESSNRGQEDLLLLA